MENRHDQRFDNDANEPMNDGENAGHDWARHQNDIARKAMSSSDDDKKEDEQDEEASEWGDVDPQHDPGSPAGPMDPSGPGSAV